jgi:RND superfamily putative drug exporter
MPLLIIAVWLGFSAVGGPYFGKIDEVSSNDLATFLPKNAESTKVNDELGKFQTSKTIPAIVVFADDSELTDAKQAEIRDVKVAIEQSGLAKGSVSAPITSDDTTAAFLLVPLDSNSEFDTAIEKLRTAVDTKKPTLQYKITGPAMFARDLNKAFAGIDGTLLIVALAVVFVILLVVYRSPILPIVTLMGAMLALSTAILVVWHMAKAGILQLNGQVQGILFILVIGAATDYALLYIARYREELMHYESAWQATKAAWKASWEPIVAAGGTVTLGLLCLLASDLGSNKALGPVGGIGVMFAVLSALTFLPAALLMIGRTAFWPRRPNHVPTKTQLDYHDSHPTWSKVGAFVGKYPRKLWVGCVALLLIACIFVPQLKASGVPQSDLIVGKSEAREGQALLNAHFPSGSGSPVYVLVPADQQDAVLKMLEADQGVDTVSVATGDSEKPSMPLGKAAEEIKQKIRATITSQQTVEYLFPVEEVVARAYPFNNVQPKIVDGNVLLQATLKDVASSLAARATIERLRTSIQPMYPTVQFGGVSAVQHDTNAASVHDLKVIIPLILTAITIVLMLLLRAVVAPLVLLATTVLSFGATLGVAALLFNHVWKFPGADPSVVIFGFVFLVALGIDYNIFLMTRVREETIKLGVRNGTLKALVVTGGVITSAGIVLASTFAALYVIPILFLAQIAFIVAFGVLLDTVIVRSIIVPGLTLTIGKAMWWPSRLSRKKD